MVRTLTYIKHDTNWHIDDSGTNVKRIHGR